MYTTRPEVVCPPVISPIRCTADKDTVKRGTFSTWSKSNTQDKGEVKGLCVNTGMCKHWLISVQTTRYTAYHLNTKIRTENSGVNFRTNFAAIQASKRHTYYECDNY